MYEKHLDWEDETGFHNGWAFLMFYENYSLDHGCLEKKAERR